MTETTQVTPNDVETASALPSGLTNGADTVGVQTFGAEISGAETGEKASTVTPAGFVHLAVWSEQHPGEGEDAPPLVLSVDGQYGLIAVFDGMGGAGSALYSDGEGFDAGSARSAAYLASRLARTVVEEHYRGLEQHAPGSDPLVLNGLEMLAGALSDQFKARADQLKGQPTQLKSSLRRRLPTTLAATYFLIHPGGCVCRVAWAGDSRCYLLTPSAGLQQLTRDDVKDAHAGSADLAQDAPLSNFVNADTAFVLNHRELATALPVILLAATDGAYNYVNTPADFECLLLQTLVQAPSAEQWQATLGAELARIAGDDVSLAACALGWSSFEALKASFRNRAGQLAELTKPLSQVTRQLADLDQQAARLANARQEKNRERQAIQGALWDAYRKTYEGWLS